MSLHSASPKTTSWLTSVARGFLYLTTGRAQRVGFFADSSGGWQDDFWRPKILLPCRWLPPLTVVNPHKSSLPAAVACSPEAAHTCSVSGGHNCVTCVMRISSSARSHRQLRISCGGSVYTVETGKCYSSGSPPPSESWLSNMYRHTTDAGCSVLRQRPAWHREGH